MGTPSARQCYDRLVEQARAQRQREQTPERIHASHVQGAQVRPEREGDDSSKNSNEDRLILSASADRSQGQAKGHS